jgi:tetratricopeptide (TPR) repeat protein
VKATALTPLAAIRVVTALACIVAPARAEDAVPPADSAARSLTITAEGVEPHSFRLGRAALEQSVGNLAGVVEQLESLDFSVEPALSEADRAAFLLAQAYLGLGSLDRFEALARSVTRWSRTSVYTRWLAYQLLLVEGGGGADSTFAADSAAMEVGTEAANALAAAILLRERDPDAALRLLSTGGGGGDASVLALHLEARALAAAGKDDEGPLDRLSHADTTTSTGRDLAGAALIQRAVRAMTRAEDPRSLLEAVPQGSRYASRARHMLGLAALERGEVDEGRRILSDLLARDTAYAARREVRTALAGQAMDEGRWEAAHEGYREADRDRERGRETLVRVRSQDSFEELWSSWQADGLLSDALTLDPRPVQARARELASSSADLGSRPEFEIPPLGSLTTDAPAFPIAPPPTEAWSEVARSGRTADEAHYQLERVRRELADERARLEDRRRYLDLGRVRVRGERVALEVQAALLDSLRAMLDSLDARLRGVRDDSKRRLALRVSGTLRSVENSLLWLHAMRRLYLEGPDGERAGAAPPGFPSTDSLIIREEALARGIGAFAESLAVGGPLLLDRSYETAWRPSVIDRAAALSAEAARQLAWARAIEAAVDSSSSAALTSEALLALEARAAALGRTVDSLDAAHGALRIRIAREAVDRSLAALDQEREGLDYGLAASAYARSVRLSAGASDSAIATAPDSSEVVDDPETAAWRGRAVEAMRGFLERHPDSPARAEIRFRLADVILVDARLAYREQMARFLAAQAEGGAGANPLPVLRPEPALELYRKILAEDQDFEHRDAVLFNAGLLLADEGDPEAARYFGELVASHPDSRYGQESWLRMGDLKFNEGSFEACIPLYTRAAEGADPGQRAIALYKMGWAHFNSERFLPAADAFRSVMDVYESGARGRIAVDIEDEAEAYLIHTLARSGGAEAFATYFDHIGARAYEHRVLLALGQHFRRYSLFDEAAAVDTLAIGRFPLHPDALLSARRLVETYDRWDRPVLAREARLVYAARFAPGGAWSAAQATDSVRAEGAEFARSSWKSVALYHHLQARRGGSRADWREALRLYESLLSTWPGDSGASALHLNAGEASFQLDEFGAALQHYDAAARSGPDSTAEHALLQSVAVTDAWYERQRAYAQSQPLATGPDTLARAVLAAADRLLERFPEHPKAADVAWRQGNLAFAHGWYDRASRDLERFAARHPSDPRVPVAANLAADALFRRGDFEAAGAAFEVALQAARRAGRDSLARIAEKAMPICAYRLAESAVAADSMDYRRHALLFERVATRFPDYEHAHLAQYRAGLAYARAGMAREAVAAMQSLIERFPRSEYVKDAHLQVARTWEAAGEREKAGEAYAAFSERYPKDESAAAAWLKAGDLFAAAGLAQRAEQLRLAYIRRFPDDLETAMEILEPLARRDLAGVSAERPLSTLLPTPRKGAKPAAPASHLADYLQRGKARPDLVSRDLLAQMRYLQAEESRWAFEAARLTLPLEKSLRAKQKLLDSLVARYRRTVDMGVAEWAHASTFRIGEALVRFGESLEKSERPADLSGDDLAAYEEVLFKQSQGFHDRGESVWSDLLRQKGKAAPEDPWIVRTQTSLWQRLAKRFYYRPEMEFPLVAATPIEARRAAKERSKGAPAPPRNGSSGARAQAQHHASEQ